MKRNLVRAMVNSVAATALVVPALMYAGTASVDAAPAVAREATPRTTLTFQIPHCKNCQVGVASYQDDGDGSPKSWDGPVKKVRDGEVAFKVPTKFTPGLSANIRAPWEGQTGYVTQIVMRYRGEDPGDRITRSTARSKHRGSPCWAGTTQDAVTIKVVAKKVRVEGVKHRVDGTLAFTRSTQEWLPWMEDAPKGVLGAQDLPPCSVA